MSAFPQASPFRIWTTSDPGRSERKRWVIEGLFAEGEVSVVASPPSTGKSALAADAVASIASGRDWFARAVNRGPTLFVAAERAAVTKRRLRAYEKHHALPDLTVGVVYEGVDLLNDGVGAHRIIATAIAFEGTYKAPVRMVVVDTARATMPGGDENSPKDMGNFARNIAAIRDALPRVHIMVLHHTPKKNPRQLSGHTALNAMADVVLIVSTRGKACLWQVTEANDLAFLPPPVSFDLVSVDLDDVDPDAGAAVVVRPLDKVFATASERMFETSEPTLKPDAQTTLKVLQNMASVSPITIEEWRRCAYKAYGDRSASAKKNAFWCARKALNGLVDEVDGTVSVRTASE